MANNSFMNAIKSYLDDFAKKDKAFATTYKKPNKSLKECCDFIISQAAKQRDQAVAVAVDDATVYGWAVHYYDEDDLKVEPVTATVAAPTKEVIDKATAEVTKKATPEVKKSKKQKAAEDFERRQLSLFDML